MSLITWANRMFAGAAAAAPGAICVTVLDFSLERRFQLSGRALPPSGLLPELLVRAEGPGAPSSAGFSGVGEAAGALVLPEAVPVPGVAPLVRAGLGAGS